MTRSKPAKVKLPDGRDLFGRRPRDANKEARIQAAVIEWIRWCAPQVVAYAVPNGGLRTKSEAARLKWQGVLPGIPDIGLVFPGGQAGFFEVKPPKEYLSDEQKEMLPRLEALGARCAVVRSIEDARAAFEVWGIETRETKTGPPRF